jgi:hypothetical protein
MHKLPRDYENENIFKANTRDYTIQVNSNLESFQAKTLKQDPHKLRSVKTMFCLYESGTFYTKDAEAEE